MSARLPFHEVVSGDLLQREEWWFLVKDEDGTKYVMRERYSINPATKAPPKVTTRRLSVKTLLERDDELSAKLRNVLREL